MGFRYIIAPKMALDVQMKISYRVDLNFIVGLP